MPVKNTAKVIDLDVLRKKAREKKKETDGMEFGKGLSDTIKSPQEGIILKNGKKGDEDALIGISDKQNSKLLNYINEYHQFADVEFAHFFLSLPTNGSMLDKEW